MIVAARDLCIKLKKLSYWGETDFCWNGDHLTPAYWPEDMRGKDLDSNPAYDLGYLRRRLLEGITDSQGRLLLSQALLDGEDATARFAIALFEDGTLWIRY
jgi:hypothetical protein